MTELLLLIALLGLSAFFSGSETALTSLSMARVESLEDEGRSGASALLRLKLDTNRMLIIILIGNNLVNTAASALATIAATQLFGNAGVGMAVGMITLLLLIFGEITPKTFGARFSTEFSLRVAPILLWLGYLFYPLVWLMLLLTKMLHHLSGDTQEPAVTESELITLAEHASRDGSIDADEHHMIKRIFEFNTLRATDIMVPRRQLFSLDGARTVQEVLPDLLANPYTRIPIYQDNPDNISRIATLRDLLEEVAQGNMEKSMGQLGIEPIFVADNQLVTTLFELLRTNKHQMIIVVDELGALQGGITLKDILEELVGKLEAADHRSFPQVKEPEGMDMLVEGGTEMRVIKAHFGLDELDLEGRITASINRWLLDKLQRIPRQGERYFFDGLEVYVEQATPRMVQTVRIHRFLGSDAPVHEGKQPPGGEDAPLRNIIQQEQP